MSGREAILDATLVPLGLIVLLTYQVFSLWRDNDKKNILAVQTLRNTIMGSTLMATTAILLCSATAVFMSSAYLSTKQSLLEIGATHPNHKLLGFKYFTLVVTFLVSFLFYAQSVRYTNHVNFLVNIPLHDATALRFSPDYVAKVLAKGCNFFSAGTRCFYFAIPLLLWLFSPIAVLCSCVMLVPLLFYLDTSDLDGDDEFLRKNEDMIVTTTATTMGRGRGVSMAPQRPNFRGTHHEMRKTNEGDILLTACPQHWRDADVQFRAAQELSR